MSAFAFIIVLTASQEKTYLVVTLYEKKGILEVKFPTMPGAKQFAILHFFEERWTKETCCPCFTSPTTKHHSHPILAPCAIVLP